MVLRYAGGVGALISRSTHVSVARLKAEDKTQPTAFSFTWVSTYTAYTRRKIVFFGHFVTFCGIAKIPLNFTKWQKRGFFLAGGTWRLKTRSKKLSMWLGNGDMHLPKEYFFAATVVHIAKKCLPKYILYRTCHFPTVEPYAYDGDSHPAKVCHPGAIGPLENGKSGKPCVIIC